MLTEIEQQTLDIDWFFISGNEIGFVASGGGKLPKSVASLDDYEFLANYFRGLPEINDIIINERVDLIKGSVSDEYLRDFVFMSKKGLYAFDKSVLNNFNDTNYHLVSKPKKPLRTNQLPPEIFELLNRTKYNGSLDTDIKINSFEIS